LYHAGGKLASKEFAGIQVKNIKEALEKIAEVYLLENAGLMKIDGANLKFLIVKLYNCATCNESEKAKKRNVGSMQVT